MGDLQLQPVIQFPRGMLTVLTIDGLTLERTIYALDTWNNSVYSADTGSWHPCSAGLTDPPKMLLADHGWWLCQYGEYQDGPAISWARIFSWHVNDGYTSVAECISKYSGELELISFGDSNVYNGGYWHESHGEGQKARVEAITREQGQEDKTLQRWVAEQKAAAT